MAYMCVETSVRTHRKMLAAGPAACWLWLCGNGYCQEGLTDGHIPESALLFLGVPAADAPILAEVLVRVKLWDRVDDGWRVHDYLDHNKSAEEIRRIMRVRGEGGKLGGRPVKTSKVLDDDNLTRNPSGTTVTSVPPVTTKRKARAVSPSATPPAVMWFSVTGDHANPDWPLTPDHLADLQRDYEHLDVLAECKKASAWVKANPGRRKTANGMPKFLVNWLNRAVERGGVQAGPSQPHRPAPAPVYTMEWAEECARLHNGECGGQFKHGIRMRASA